MRKRLSSKLLSVILTLAICATTVFGCLMTANAADEVCCAQWSEGSTSKELDMATIYLALQETSPLENGIWGAEFQIDCGTDLLLKNVEAIASAKDFTSVKKDGSAFNEEGIMVAYSDETNWVTIDSGVGYSTIVLEVTVGFKTANGLAKMGELYDISIANDTLWLLDNRDNEHKHTAGAIAGSIKASCDHVIGVVGDPIKVDTANNYSVYENSVCTLCGETFGMQLVPEARVSEDSGITITWSAEGTYDDNLIDDADGEQDGSSDHPIIINSVEELYYLAAKAGITETANKYYKLADGITKVVFQSAEKANTIIGLENADEVESNFGSGSWFTWSGDSSKVFAGHFDGNGATFYGLYAKEAMTFGLFPHVAVADDTLNADIASRLKANNSDYANNAFNINGPENVTSNTVKVSNVNIKNSYVTINKDSTWSATAGFIFGKSVAIDGYLARYLATIEKCSIINCYMYSGSSSYGVAQMNGLFAGDFSACLKPTYIKTDGTSADWYGATNGVKINNCLAYGNSLSANNSYDDTFSIAGRANYSAGGMVSNSIFLGVLPYMPPCTTNNADPQVTFSSHRGNKSVFTNIYTDVKVLEVKYSDSPKYDANSNFTSVLTKITDLNSLKVSAAVATCSKLDWGTTWLIGENDGYPYLAGPNYTTDTIYWDGKVATGIAKGTGSDTDPFIISSVSELAWLVKESTKQEDKGDANVTKGKHYKIADGIKNIVLQPYAYGNDIMALDSAARTKAYFENGSSFTKWVNEGWEGGTFAGTFDGNGATIYGMYQKTDTNAGLFSTIDAGVTIKNIAIKNSYLVVDKIADSSKPSGYTDYQLSTLAATSSSNSYGAQEQGVIWINNCEVSNCYMRQNTSIESGYNSRAGVLVGNMQYDVVGVDDCIVYGNDATYGRESNESVNMPLMGHAGHSDVLSTGIKPEGYEPVLHTEYNEDKSVKAVKYVATVRNSIILGCDVMNVVLGRAWRRNSPGYSYKNVYTDGVSGKVTFPDATSWEYPESEIKAITLTDATGHNAETNLPGLAWGTEWYCGEEGKLPVLAPFATFGAAEVSTFEHQLYGSSVTYNDDGTLDFNLHFVPQYEGVKATLLVGTADASKVLKLTSTESSYRDDLGDTALMFTLPNISARDIDKVWLPTIVVEGGEKTEWGRSQPIALVDNSKAILLGDYDAADKQVAAALINYGVAAEEALTSTTKPSSERNVVYVQYGNANNIEPDGSFMDGTHGTGTEADPYVISTPGQLRYLAQKSTYETTHGKFFEIDKNIDILCLQSKSYIGDIDKFMAKSAEEVMTFLSNATNRCQWQSGHANTNNCFSGTLDGNGVTIVGMYTINGGLFNAANEGAAFKNITVSNSYITAGWYAGAILGSAYASETYIATIPNNTNCYGVVSFDNITVNDNYILNKGNAQQCTGALVGSVTSTYRDLIDKNTGKPGTDGTKEGYGHIAVYASNILTYDNSIWAETAKDSGNIVSNQTLFGKLATGHNGMDAGYPNGYYDNVVTIDCVPFAFETSSQAFRAPYFKNVYSGLPQPDYVPSEWYTTWNLYDITFVDAANLTGAAAKTSMPNLDWVNTWVVTDKYPVLADVDYVAPATGGKTIYWSGTNNGEGSLKEINDTNATGTSWKNPIIIDNAEELYWLIQKSGNTTNNLFFKVADDIERIVLQPEGVLDLAAIEACKDGSDVQKYFEKVGLANLKNWSSNPYVFSANFDGNGAEIIGAYGSGAKVGFIGAWDGGKKGAKVTEADEYNYTTSKDGAITGYYNVNTDNVGVTVKNVIIKNSYFVSSDRLAVLGAQVQGPAYGAYVDGVLNLDKCAIINSYLKNSGRASKFGENSIVVNSSNTDAVKMSNMLVYGNEALDMNGDALWFRGAMVDTAVHVLDENGNKTDAYIKNTVTNSIILGTLPYKGASFGWIDGPDKNFTNIYTDAPNSVTYPNGTTLTFTSDQLTTIDAADLIGANAQSILDKLNTNGVKFYAGILNEGPSFKKAGNVPAAYQSKIDAVKFDTPDVVGNGTEYYSSGSMKFGVYQTALSLKANPYMSFAFAFGDYYKTNRDKIKIRFTYTENGATKTSDEISVPAAVDANGDGKIDDIKNVNGWTNTTANGRFHTFKAECIPVEALAYGIKVEASYDGGEWKDFGKYGVEGLGLQFDSLNKTEPSDYYATRVEATRALLFYAQVIAARYGA